jgi:nitrite reductase/ring-hydroxylating ferredoxin subunit
VALRVRVCRVAEVSADRVHAFPVEGVTWPVLVARLDGAIVATPGVCPHEDVGLAGGAFDGKVLTCPGHGYRFDLATGTCEHDAALHLRRYPVTIIDDEVWVDLL